MRTAHHIRPWLARFVLVIMFALIALAARYGADLQDRLAGWPRGNELLLSAAGNGDNERLERALAEGADVNARDIFGTTALMLACSNGNEATVRRLVDHDAAVTLDNHGIDALNSAVITGNTSIVRLLIQSGADPRRVLRGRSAIDYAIEYNSPAMVRVLSSTLRDGHTLK